MLPISMPGPRPATPTTSKPGTEAPQRTPDVTYEFRSGTPFSGDHYNLGRQGRVPLGQARVLIQRLPIDTVFHFHRYDPKRHEVPLGENWCALRALIKTKEPHRLRRMASIGKSGSTTPIPMSLSTSSLNTLFRSCRIGRRGKVSSRATPDESNLEEVSWEGQGLFAREGRPQVWLGAFGSIPGGMITSMTLDWRPRVSCSQSRSSTLRASEARSTAGSGQGWTRLSGCESLNTFSCGNVVKPS